MAIKKKVITQGRTADDFQIEHKNAWEFFRINKINKTRNQTHVLLHYDITTGVAKLSSCAVQSLYFFPENEQQFEKAFFGW